VNLTQGELEFLSAWAREEWEPACYQLPAHRLQLDHGIAGALLIPFIKVWTENQGKKDRDILCAADNPQPLWPWSSAEEFHARLEDAIRQRASRDARKTASGV
jgi:hypothetical protein